MDASSPFSMHKRLKEEFVSNLDGTTMLEIAALSAVVPTFVIVRQWGGLLLSSGEKEISSSTKPTKPAKLQMLIVDLVLDFIVVIVPTLACLTILADWVYSITAGVLGLLLATILNARWLQWSPLAVVPSQTQNESSRKAYLSSYRFVMMLVTCVTILAVDFTVLPRRYAKTETYGTGLMDIGVGSFVVANALVSRQARNLPPSKYGGVLRNTSPLLILGIARLIVTKGVDYQEHVAEYGVHWNFFFTLAAVALLTSLVHIPPTYCGTLGIIILTVYQIVLSCGLNTFLLSSERGPGILSLNKEGVASTFGYWGLYLISVQAGHHLNFTQGNFLQRSEESSNSETKGKAVVSHWWTVVEILLFDLALWGLACFLDHFVEQISRRTCNLAYVMFVLAQNFEVIGLFMLADLLVPPKGVLVLDIFDHNLLPTFLLANVLTGVVNMSMHTIFVGPFWACITLLAYLATLVGFMALAEAHNLRLKFW